MPLRPLMSDAEIKHRKKLQGKISVATSTLGLTALGLKVGSGALPKASRFARANPAKLARASRKMNDYATSTSIAAGGVGGLGGYNFAAYTNAESRKRGQIKKNHGGLMDFGLDSVHQGESVEISKLRVPNIKLGNAKRMTVKSNVIPTSVARRESGLGTPSPKRGLLTPLNIGVATAGAGAAGGGAYVYHRKVSKAYDPERKRARRMDHASAGLNAGAGAAVAGAAMHGRDSHHSFKLARLYDQPQAPVNPRMKVKPLDPRPIRDAAAARGLKSAGKAGALGLGAVGMAVGANRIQSYKKGRGATYRSRANGF